MINREQKPKTRTVVEMLNNLIANKHINIMSRVVLLINIVIIFKAGSKGKVYCEQRYQG
jgi:hypothetical protein